MSEQEIIGDLYDVRIYHLDSGDVMYETLGPLPGDAARAWAEKRMREANLDPQEWDVEYRPSSQIKLLPDL